MFVACHWISFLFKGWIIFHRVYIPHLVYPSSVGRHGLLPPLGHAPSFKPFCGSHLPWGEVTRPPKLDLIAETVAKPALSLQPHPLSQPHVCDAVATLDSLKAPRHTLFPLAVWPLHMFFSLSGMLYLPSLPDPPISCLSLSGPFCLSLDKLILTPQIWNCITLDHPFLFSCRFVPQAWELFLEQGLFYWLIVVFCAWWV